MGGDDEQPVGAAAEQHLEGFGVEVGDAAGQHAEAGQRGGVEGPAAAGGGRRVVEAHGVDLRRLDRLPGAGTDRPRVARGLPRQQDGQVGVDLDVVVGVGVVAAGDDQRPGDRGQRRGAERDGREVAGGVAHGHVRGVPADLDPVAAQAAVHRHRDPRVGGEDVDAVVALLAVDGEPLDPGVGDL